jgi:hypothetical protein
VVRRLPVLQSSSEDDPQRPPWHYVFIGAGFTVTLWLPLAILATWVGSRLILWVPGVAALQAVPLMLSFWLACSASAVLVGRFGGKAGVREAVFGNLLGSAVVLGIAALAGGVGIAVAMAATVFLAVSSALAGWVGARLGRRLRP